jgi:hypothetical protein
MQSCPSCKGNLLDHGTHCPSCGVQARCKSCKELLTFGISFCVNCGTQIGEAGLTQVNGNGEHTTGPVFNIIEIDRDTRSSHFRAKVTDDAINSLSNPLTMYLAGQAGLPVRRSQQPNVTDVTTDEQQPLLPGLAAEDGDQSAQEKAVGTGTQKALPAPKAEGSEIERLKELFRARDGELRLEEPQLKATGKLDYAQRLTYLFLYAHEKEGHESVLRSALNTILERADVLDAHAGAWIKKETKIVKEEDGAVVRLNAGGRREALKYLEEAFDPERTEDWLPGESNSMRSSKAGATGDKSANQAAKPSKGKAERKSKVKTVWLPKWKALKLNVDGHSLINKRQLGEKGMFGLWAIRKALGDEAGKVISRRHLTDFLYHAFDIDVDESHLARALKAKDMKDKVLHVGGTKFQILPPGMSAAEKIAGVKGAAKK